MKMNHTTALKIILGLAGILILIPGAMALFAPETFTARNGANITDQIALLNDYRGLGGMMLASGIVMILGILHSRMAFTSVIVAIAMHGTLALGRLISLGADGMPPRGMIAAMVVEFVLAGLAAFALLTYRVKEEEREAVIA